MYPYAEVQIDVCPRDDAEQRIIICAENFGERYVVNPESLGWDRHPMIEAAIARMGIPEELTVNITVHSEAPAGCATGTSAAVSVALIGALDRLTPGRLNPHQVAHIAHSIETEMLGQQCGIQDQLCSAYGGINFIEMFEYPHACVSQILPDNSIWWELERRLVLIYLGKSHSSSDVHKQVVKTLEGLGPDCAQLSALRLTAQKSANAIYSGDFQAFGEAMKENTRAQESLDASLVCEADHQIIEIAKAHGAIGWKVNGAGGDGGSISLLCGGSSFMKRAMIREIEQSNPLFKNIPIHLSRQGLRTWEEPLGGELF